MTAFGLRIVGFGARDYVLSMSRLRHSLDELARLGDELYDREVLPRATEAQRGMYVAIDVDTGTFAIDANQLAAADQVRVHNPEAQIWFRRVGLHYVHRIGGRRLPRHGSLGVGGGELRLVRRSEGV